MVLCFSRNIISFFWCLSVLFIFFTISFANNTLFASAQVAAGGYHSISLKSDGTVWAWGYNAYGQLGIGTTQKTTPIQVNGISNVIAIAGGYNHTIALKSDGTVWTLGYNTYGKLGDGTYIDRTTPIQVNELNGISTISGGGYHTVALKSDGTVWTWGYNAYGQLADSTTTNSFPQIKFSDSAVSQLSHADCTILLL